jgi:hypothetical protein
MSGRFLLDVNFAMKSSSFCIKSEKLQDGCLSYFCSREWVGVRAWHQQAVVAVAVVVVVAPTLEVATPTPERLRWTGNSGSGSSHRLVNILHHRQKRLQGLRLKFHSKKVIICTKGRPSRLKSYTSVKPWLADIISYGYFHCFSRISCA